MNQDEYESILSERDREIEDLMLEINDKIDHFKTENAQLKVKLVIANEALLWAEEMFVARDQMNSKVHCAPVRLSPITERVIQAREALSQIIKPD